MVEYLPTYLPNYLPETILKRRKRKHFTNTLLVYAYIVYCIQYTHTQVDINTYIQLLRPCKTCAYSFVFPPPLLPQQMPVFFRGLPCPWSRWRSLARARTLSQKHGLTPRTLFKHMWEVRFGYFHAHVKKERKKETRKASKQGSKKERRRMKEIKQESDWLIDCKAERERERERERDGENTKKERKNYLLCWQISNLEQFQRQHQQQRKEERKETSSDSLDHRSTTDDWFNS